MGNRSSRRDSSSSSFSSRRRSRASSTPQPAPGGAASPGPSSATGSPHRVPFGRRATDVSLGPKSSPLAPAAAGPAAVGQQPARYSSPLVTEPASGEYTGVLAWGANDHAELALPVPEAGPQAKVPRPLRAKLLSDKDIVDIAVGSTHALALSQSGELFAWGGNARGQAFASEGEHPQLSEPRRVASLESKTVCRIGCGFDHSVAVDATGSVLSVGDNEHMQLGDSEVTSRATPKFVAGLGGISIVKIACGAHHCMVLSDLGAVYTWGQGYAGQLGTGESANRSTPKKVSALRSNTVVDIACGEMHSLAATDDREIMAWGRSTHGQCGLIADRVVMPALLTAVSLEGAHIVALAGGGTHSVYVLSNGHVFSIGGPNKSAKVEQVMGFEVGTSIVQVECGRAHSVALSADGVVYTWGAGEHGQLGSTDELASASWPKAVEFTLPAGSMVVRVAAGGDHTFALLRTATRALPTKKPEVFSYQRMVAFLERPDNQKVIKHMLDVMYSSPDTFTRPFVQVQPPEVGSGDSLTGRISFVRAAIDKYYGMLAHANNPSIFKFVASAEHRLLTMIEAQLKENPEREQVLMLLLPVCLMFFNPAIDGRRQHSQSMIGWLCSLVTALDTQLQGVWTKIWMEVPADMFLQALRALQAFLSDGIRERQGKVNQLDIKIVEVLSFLDSANQGVAKVPITEFYNAAISDMIDIERDYVFWLQDPTIFTFCRYPFVLNAEVKSKVLKLEAGLQMRQQVQRVVLNQLMQGFVSTPHLVLHIRRDHLIEDTMRQVSAVPTIELKRPLLVHFVGEEGIDMGGVRKEFFQLLVDQIFSEHASDMFTYNETTRQSFFNPATQTNESSFYLVGVVLGMAIYNSVMLDAHLPLAVYKKVIGDRLGLEDLTEVDPALGKGLAQLLEYSGDDVEDVFCRTFTVDLVVGGERKEVELQPGGADIPVTNENRAVYVDLVVRYYLNDSIKEPFEAFERGFLAVIGGPLLRLLRAQELDLLICGSQELDFHELEKVTQYKGGYSPTHTTIRRFWTIVHAWPQDMKRKLLAFSTGCDRAPIGGLKTMTFIIQRSSGDTRRLPSASTCFNVLHLPDYKSQQDLQSKLEKAVNDCVGFALE